MPHVRMPGATVTSLPHRLGGGGGGEDVWGGVGGGVFPGETCTQSPRMLGSARWLMVADDWQCIVMPMGWGARQLH